MINCVTNRTYWLDYCRFSGISISFTEFGELKVNDLLEVLSKPKNVGELSILRENGEYIIWKMLTESQPLTMATTQLEQFINDTIDKKAVVFINDGFDGVQKALMEKNKWMLLPLDEIEDEI
jgi:hypothetical protein